MLQKKEVLKSKISRLDCFGKLRIPFSDKISTKGINFSDINSSNTDIRIIPYNDPSTQQAVNITKYNLTWITTQLTEQELEIQLDFEDPDSISRQKIYD